METSHHREPQSSVEWLLLQDLIPTKIATLSKFPGAQNGDSNTQPAELLWRLPWMITDAKQSLPS